MVEIMDMGEVTGEVTGMFMGEVTVKDNGKLYLQPIFQSYQRKYMFELFIKGSFFKKNLIVVYVPIPTLTINFYFFLSYCVSCLY